MRVVFKIGVIGWEFSWRTRAGALNANLRNEHLQYAITWYGLAVVVVVMFAFWLRSRSQSAPQA